MSLLKKVLLFFSFFTFLISIELIVINVRFYNLNKQMYSDVQKYSKEYILIDSTCTKTIGTKNKVQVTYGFSKKFDNYKTVFDLNIPYGVLLTGNYAIINPIVNPLNNNSFYYYAWVNKENNKGYICDINEKSIKENWIFLEHILFVKANIFLILFSLIVFYWTKIFSIIIKKINTKKEPSYSKFETKK